MDPQSVYLSLDLETGEAECDWTGMTNGVPVGVYHNRIVQWLLPSGIRCSVCRDMMDEIAPQLQTILDNSEMVVDCNCNRVGELNETAIEAQDQIQDAIYRLSEDPWTVASIYTVEDYLADCSDVEKLIREGKTVSDIVAQIEDYADSEDVIVEGSIETYIQEIADSLADEAE